jgi:pimeloyl-ACP methyl ester carboxylesterase
MSTEIYYEVTGTGPPLVFAHGLGGNHASWFNQVPFFSRWFTVITFDHRGFGNSRELEGGADRSRFPDDLKRLVDALGIEKASFVAQSMGGGTCAAFALENPNRVSGLVLADTLVGITLPEALRPRMDEVRKATSGLPQLERVLSYQFRAREPTLTHLYSQLNSFNGTARESIRGALPPISIERLSATGIPILFLVGANDILFPPELVKQVQERIPGSAYQEVPGSGHSVYFEKPQEFNDIVLSFLRKSEVLSNISGGSK